MEKAAAFSANPLRQAFQQIMDITETEDQAWWDSLDQEERARCFRQVMKLMYRSEISDGGSYRWAMYDVFGIDYCDGLPHYMRLHNLIYCGLETEKKSYKTDDMGGHSDSTSN
jgi:hypothetical protein